MAVTLTPQMSIADVLAALQAGETNERAVAEWDAARAATTVPAEKEGRKCRLYFKVGRKGAISAYGLQRMPVTLYIAQWETILGKSGECDTEFAKAFWSFVEKNDGRVLKVACKDDFGRDVEVDTAIVRKGQDLKDLLATLPHG